MNNDDLLLSEFKKVLLRNAFHPVINLDEKFPHKIDLFAQAYEIIIDKVGDYIPPHKWSHYRIGLLTDGSADYTCGMYKFKAKENTLLVIPPRVVTASSNWAPESKGYFLLFNLDFFLQAHFPHRYLENKTILQPYVQPYIQLSASQAKTVEKSFQTIMLENQSNHAHKQELIALKILELLILGERLYLEINDVDNHQVSIDLVKRFTNMVEVHFTKERAVSFYASQLNIHPNYLNSVIKTYSGLTAKDSIQNRLILEAKYLLHSTNLSIKEIANQLGFEDPNYFAVFFKRSEGQPPITYRSNNVI